MQQPPTFATNRRVGCIMWLAIVALILSIIGLFLDITQEMAWNQRVEQSLAVAPVANIIVPNNTPELTDTSMPPTAVMATVTIVNAEANTPLPTSTLEPPTVAPSPTPTPVTLLSQGYTAADVMHAFRTTGLPIGDVIEYTAESDPNGLLGRPNQYIGKVSWKDTRIEEQGDPGTSTGGTVEVFLTIEDMQARKSYVESLSKSASFLAEYSYSNGTILLRLSHDLTPDEARDYENALLELPSRH